jgi:hypothetical protein
MNENGNYNQNEEEFFNDKDPTNIELINANQIQNLYNYIIRIKEKNRELTKNLKDYEDNLFMMEGKAKKLSDLEEVNKLIQVENK